MVRAATLTLCALAACTPNAPETVLTELRVVGFRADPPLLSPEAGGRLEAVVHRPDDTPVDVVMWTCTPASNADEAGGACAESTRLGGPSPLSGWAAVRTLDLDDGLREEVATVDVDGPGADGVATAWALACARDEEGRSPCELVRQLQSPPSPGTSSWTEFAAALSDPEGVLRALPIAGTAATTRPVPVVALPPGVPAPTNPTLTLTEPQGPLRVPSGGRLDLTFAVGGADGVPEELRGATVFPLATAGGFVAVSTDVTDDEATVTFTAGEADNEMAPALEPGLVAELYVGVERGDGGAATWRGRVVVTDPEPP